MASLLGQGSLPDIGIHVSLKNGISLTELTLSEKALRLTPDRLAHNISQCIKLAEVDYARNLEKIIAEAEGNDEATRSMHNLLHQEYPDVDLKDDSPWAGNPSAHQVDEEDDDDEGWNKPILRS